MHSVVTTQGGAGRYIRSSLLLLGVCTSLLSTGAQAACDQLAGRFVSLDGDVDVLSSDTGSWTTASLTTELCEGDTVRVGDNSRSAIALVNDAVLRIDERSSVRLVNIVEAEEEPSLIDMARGALQAFSRKPKRFSVNTPYINGSIEGTEWLIRADEDSGRITVFEGLVVAGNDLGSVAVAAGEQADAGAGTAPVKSIPVRPRDQVAWSLYFPRALVTSSNADAQQASVLLQHGRVDEARELLQRVLATDPNNSDALALRTILKVVTLDGAAVADGEQAVTSDSNSASARIALSYAYQAEFRLRDALDTLQAGATGESALLLARLAEVQLMLDRKRDALATAERAVTADPRSDRAVAVQGFAALAEFRAADARASFEQAIVLNSANPMNHLGLGLAEVSAGNLAAGRQSIEAAVALDSNSALLRSYLAKAYFEEKRSELAPEQLDIAVQLDPNDPTAFLYSGIIKQTINRPVQAVSDLEQSRALNDNRAVYRSRLLLDRDEAARGTSLARAYQDLGFRQVAIVEATNSLTSDPGNAAAHRFLSDAYRNEPRTEVARVSELLQAQMMQDINVNPVQPSRADTSLNIVTAGGPASTGFSEFTPLFERNRNQYNATAGGGSNETWFLEGVASGTLNGFSYSAGAYHYETDGWRDNNDLEHDIFTLFGQYAITPRLNVQAEYRHRESQYGDLSYNVDPDIYLADLDNDFEEDSFRLGLRWTLNEANTLLFSTIYADRDLEQSFSDGFEAPGVTFKSENSGESDTDVTQLEAQWLTRIGMFDFTSGISWADVDKQDDISINITQEITIAPGFPPLIIEDLFEDSLQPDPEDTRAYVYGYASFPENVHWTLGYSYQEYEEEAYDLDEDNVKAGVEWQPLDGLTLRGAYFEVMKPVLGSNRTLEPTQVAGFNQLFDDPDATYSEVYGVAADWKIGQGWYVGAEYTDRDLDAPSTDLGGGTVFDARKEKRSHFYVNWAPNEDWALGLAYTTEEFDNDEDSNLGDAIPLELDTDTVPASVSYFHPNGLFATLTVTWVDQTSKSDVLEVGIPGFEDPLLRPEGDDSFYITDVTLGWRLPRRMGIISLAVQNAFDEEFEYQDDSFRTFGDEPAILPYSPERTMVVSLTLSF